GRIDDERAGPVVGRNLEAEAAPSLLDVAAGNGHARATGFLIDDRGSLHERARERLDHEIPAAIEPHVPGAFDPNLDGLRLTARSDDEVVLEPALVSVVGDIDSRIGVRL